MTALHFMTFYRFLNFFMKFYDVMISGSPVIIAEAKSVSTVVSSSVCAERWQLSKSALRNLF